MIARAILLSVFLLHTTLLAAQWRLATVTDQGHLQTQPIQSPRPAAHRQAVASIDIMDGFPLVFPADEIQKNFRNVTLVELDDAPGQEIVVGILNQVYAMSGSRVLWSNPLLGWARFPAATGDIDGDGHIDIVLLTGYIAGQGAVYVFEADGRIKEGWPKTFGGTWMLSSPSLADLDGDGTLEIICGGVHPTQGGSLYVLRADGSTFSEHWPVNLPNTPAVTPSIGDVDADGQPEIVIHTTREIYVLDTAAAVEPGWPFGNGQTRYSFQSPLLVDFDGDMDLEIVGAGHWTRPEFFVMDAQGQYWPGWPVPVKDNLGTFQAPTVVSLDGEFHLLSGKPGLSSLDSDEIVYNRRPDGTLREGFPIRKFGGLEGLITVADLDDDREPEMLFSSNLFDPDGRGYIHAYEMDGTGELPGYPLRMHGYTFTNGANVGDVNGDGLMDLVVLSYTANAVELSDSTLLYVYELQVPYAEDRVWFSTYKGDNSRNGLVSDPLINRTGITEFPNVRVYPNPATDRICIKFAQSPSDQITLEIFDNQGRQRHYSRGPKGASQLQISTYGFAAGVYTLVLRAGDRALSKRLVVMPY